MHDNESASYGTVFSPNDESPGTMVYFHAGTEEYVLFKSGKIDSWGEMLAACIALTVVAILYEGFKKFRSYLTDISARRRHPYVRGDCEEGFGMIGDYEEKLLSRKERNSVRRIHFLQAALHVMQVFIGYCLMMVFMTLNVYLCIAILIGSGMGYLVFNWR